MVNFKSKLDYLSSSRGWGLKEGLIIEEKASITRSYKGSEKNRGTVSSKKANVIEVIKIKRSLRAILKGKITGLKGNEKPSRKLNEIICSQRDTEAKSFSRYEGSVINESRKKEVVIRAQENIELKILRLYEGAWWKRISCKES